MTDIEFRSDIEADLVQVAGDDFAILRAMLVSTGKDLDEVDAKSMRGRIEFLMKNRHGTPFEHASLTFRIEAPISVFREFHRHRTGWSYNETSGRYRELEPVFYVPRADRPLVQEGKPGHYVFVRGTAAQMATVQIEMREAYRESYATYRRLLEDGVAKEVARQVLPVGIYSSMYATCNPRSLMHFLSLRTKDESATFPSYPMDEIELVARAMEVQFAMRFPVTYEAWTKHGRVAP